MTLRIRNWDKWQSYRSDRNQPPWIKIHRRLMHDQDWVSLTDTQRGQLVALWMLAADRVGIVPASPSVIRRLCHMTSTPNLKLLIEKGFLENLTPSGCQDDANVTPQTRLDKTRKEEKREREEKIPLSGSPLPKDWKPNSEHIMLADQLGIGLALSVDTFRDWARAQGKLLHNWDARFNTWLRDQQKRERTGNGKASASERGYEFAKRFNELTSNGGGDSGSIKDYLAISKR